MLDDSIFHEIQHIWKQGQERPNSDIKKKPAPDIRDLRVLIEISFLASLRREEGRPLTFAIILLPKWESPGPDHKILRFTESILFTDEAVSKLAPAFDPKITALIVGPTTEERIEYEIWGAIYFGSSSNYFQEIPAGVDRIRRPDLFMITVTSVGSLLFSREYSQLCRFSRGKIIPTVPTPFFSKAMGGYLIEIVKNDTGFKKFENYYWQIYWKAVDYLLSEASLRGHGGTIILLSNDLLEKYAGKFTGKYGLAGRLQVDLLIMQLLSYNDPGKTLLILALKKRIMEQLSILANLACLDGALLLTSNLRIISFGTILKPENEWTGKVIVGPYGSRGGGGRKYSVKTLGTRHNSAVNFIGECPGSVGFVISQDGPICGFVRKDEQTILCWPDCMPSVFV